MHTETTVALLFSLLEPCAAVRFLGIRHTLDLREHTAHGTLLERLCAFLERGPPLRHTLEHLALSLLERDGEMVGVSEALGARLASVLGDREVFPAFRRLEVRVEKQVWEGAFGCWVMPVLREREVEAEAAKKWKRVFEAFGECQIRVTNGGGFDV